MNRQVTETPFAHEINIGNPAQAILAQFPQYTNPTTYSTAGVMTMTAAQIMGGLIVRDCGGASRADVTPTAAAIIAAMTGVPKINQSFMFAIINTSDAAETITVTSDGTTTLVGLMTIAQNAQGLFLACMTGATTVTIYRLS
jgi:hypothetical protein